MIITFCGHSNFSFSDATKDELKNLLIEKIRKYTPENIRLVTQGAAVAASLKSYLCRHKAMDELCTKGGNTIFCTTEAGGKFGAQASLFLNYPVEVKNVSLD